MILCLTHSKDHYTIDIVQHALQEAGYDVLRFNSDEFAIQYQLQYTLGGDTNETYLELNGKKIRAQEIEAVWYRKLWNLQVPQGLDPAWRDVFTKEYQAYLNIFFNSLQHVPWINPMQADHTVGNDKLLQLRLAREAGLQVPASVFTNQPQVIQSFFEQCKGDMIVKLHGALSRSMEGNTPFFPTTRLREEDLDQLDQLAYCPMIFQEFIPKDYELRIIYVDGTFFTGKIPAEGSDPTDWRSTKGARIEWQHYELPDVIKQSIDNMMRRMGLLFGAIDMIKNTNGEYVFLEVNPQGEWGMIQKSLSYPIGQTIAQKLITRIHNG